MEPDLPASVADRDNTTRGTASKDLIGFNMEAQTGGTLIDGSDMQARDTQDGIGAGAPRTTWQGSRISHVRVSFEDGCLIPTNSKRP